MHRTLVVSILLIAATAHADERRRSATAPRTSDERRVVDGNSLAVVTFDRRSAKMTDAALDRLDDIAAWHADHPDSLLFIEGRDARAGSWNQNLRISQRRTDAVREALVRAGADPNRMVLVARGDNPAGKRAKGRVVIRASGQFTELAYEQRDPEVGEDARAARRATMNDQRTRSGTADRAGAGGANPVVVVPGGAAAGGGQTGPAPSGTNVDVAGGAGRTSGGAGTSAQTGIGDDPEARGSAGGATVTGTGVAGAGVPGGTGAGATGAGTGATGAGTGAGATGGIGATGTGATGSGVGATGTGATGGGTTGTGATGATGTGGPGAGTTSGTGAGTTGGRGGATGAGGATPGGGGGGR